MIKKFDIPFNYLSFLSTKQLYKSYKTFSKFDIFFSISVFSNSFTSFESTLNGGIIATFIFLPYFFQALFRLGLTSVFLSIFPNTGSY